MTDNLLKKLYFYDSNNLPISGNPELSLFAFSASSIIRKRHTNFSNGLISVKPSYIKKITSDTKLYQYSFIPDFDLLKNIVINLKNIDITNIIDITINVEQLKIVLPLKYIQIYNMISEKIIFPMGSSCMIIIPINNNNFLYSKINFHLFTSLPCYKTNFSISINLLDLSNLENDTTNYNPNYPDIEVKLQSICVDTKERSRISYFHSIKNYQVYPLTLPKKNSNTFDLSSVHNCIDTNSIVNLGIRVENFESLDSIEITFNDNSIKLGIETIKLYDKFYNKIIYQFENSIIIKIKSIFFLTYSTQFDVKLYYKDTKYNMESDAFVCNNMHNMDMESFLLFADNELMSYFKEYSFDMKDFKNNKQIFISEPYPYHIKEMFIYWTEKNYSLQEHNQTNPANPANPTNPANPKNLAKKIIISYPEYENLTDTYTELDCVINQQIGHSGVIDPNIFTIGYSLIPRHIYPTGEINVPKSVSIAWELKDELKDSVKNQELPFDISKYQMNVIIFGYRVLAKQDN